MDASIAPSELAALLQSGGPARPLLIDVRRMPAFMQARDLIAGALRRDPVHVGSWLGELPRAADIAVYCVHGHEVSQGVARALRDAGLRARYLADGIEGWRTHGGALAVKSPGVATRWVTRERPKIDRIACPWLIARFIDRDAEFLYVPADRVRDVAEERTGIAFDIPGADFGHVGERCSFDAFLDRFNLVEDPALARLAHIVRAADTGHPEHAPEAAGLLAASRGLSLTFGDDHTMLRHAMMLYDALYASCREGVDADRTWRLHVPY